MQFMGFCLPQTRRQLLKSTTTINWHSHARSLLHDLTSLALSGVESLHHEAQDNQRAAGRHRMPFPRRFGQVNETLTSPSIPPCPTYPAHFMIIAGQVLLAQPAWTAGLLWLPALLSPNLSYTLRKEALASAYKSSFSAQNAPAIAEEEAADLLPGSMEWLQEG